MPLLLQLKSVGSGIYKHAAPLAGFVWGVVSIIMPRLWRFGTAGLFRLLVFPALVLKGVGGAFQPDASFKGWPL